MVSTLNQLIVNEYAELVKGREGVVVLSMDGLTVDESQRMRNLVRESGADLRVTRVRLARVAMREAEVPLDLAGQSGLTGLLVGDVEATIAAAKAIEKEWEKAKDQRKVHFRAAWLDGSLMGPEEAARIPAMPDRQTLRGMLCSVLSAPARQLAQVINEVSASTARALQARADQEDAA
ncbi:MAG: 50S ribosomal protein L10 [Planctomycetota bacterium]|nr:MAG: 50S ribosomal protein L10 [Planctomycetota bacterium]